jgi:hypothetical protein
MISLDKKYRTRSGKDVTIYSVGNEHICGVHGSVNGEALAWAADGKFNPYAISSSEYDLIEVDEYSEILTEARRRYNVGDTVIALDSGGEETITSFESHGQKLAFTRSNSLWVSPFAFMIYDDGKWADKVLSEEAQPEVIDLDAITTDSLINLITRCVDNLNNRRA